LQFSLPGKTGWKVSSNTLFGDWRPVERQSAAGFHNNQYAAVDPTQDLPLKRKTLLRLMKVR